MKIKIITGFRDDQYYSIDIEEAHKAYYLFLHPEQRGIFQNGVAIRGSDIHSIEPDYHNTMGWNPTHKLDGEDWNEIRGKKIDLKIRNLLVQAQELSTLSSPPINQKLSDAIKLLPEKLSFSQEVNLLANKMKV